MQQLKDAIVDRPNCVWLPERRTWFPPRLEVHCVPCRLGLFTPVSGIIKTREVKYRAENLASYLLVTQAAGTVMMPAQIDRSINRPEVCASVNLL